MNILFALCLLVLACVGLVEFAEKGLVAQSLSVAGILVSGSYVAVAFVRRQRAKSSVTDDR